MSYHIHLKNFVCPKCSEVYIPYQKDLPCPNCGTMNTVSDERYFNFITDCIQSMKAHKKQFGRYRPNAWYIGTYTEQIQSLTFELFDALEASGPTDKQNYVTEYISGLDADPWLKHHLINIDLAIYDEYLKNPKMARKGRGIITWVLKFI